MPTISSIVGLHQVVSFEKKRTASPPSKNCTTVALDLLKTTRGVQKLVVKPANLIFKTVKYGNSGLSPEWNNLYIMTKTANKVLKVASLPSLGLKWAENAKKLFEAVSQKKSPRKIAKASAKAGLSTLYLTMPITTAIELGEKTTFYSLSSRAVSILKGMKIAGLIGAVVGIAMGIVKEGKRLSKIDISSLKLKNEKAAHEWKKIQYSLLKLLKLINVTSLVILILLSITAGIFIPPLLFISLTAAGLAIGTGLYFFKQLQDPYQEKLLERRGHG